MPTEYLNRTLTLRTAVNSLDFGVINGGPGSLSELTSMLHTQFATIGTRRTMFDGQIVEGRNLQVEPDGLSLLHLVAYTPDDQISVVPTTGNVPAADLELLAAPQGTEFLDGELMLLVANNDVAICRSGLSERAFNSYIQQLAQRAGIPNGVSSFELLKRADIDKLEMVRREGIKKVSMNSVVSAMSANHLERQSIRKTVLNDLWEDMKAILNIDRDIDEDAENLKVEVLFTFDKRNGTVLDQRQIATLAQRMLADDEDEGFVIETLSGKKLRANDVVLSKPARLRAYGKSVSHRDAWASLREFWEEINHGHP